MKYSAAFYEAFEEEQKELKTFLPSGHNYFFTWKTIQEEHKLNDKPISKIISIRTQSKIPDNWATELEGIITRSTGYDHVKDYLTRNFAKIAVAYLPDYAARAVAEHAMMLWTCLLRKSQHLQIAFKTFHRDSLTGREIKNRKIVVIGAGRIGSQIIDIAAGLQMDYCAVDIVETDELKEKYRLKYLSLEDAVKRSEIIISALPLTPVTKGMLNKELLSTAPKGAVFVNVGRGEVSYNRDLLELVQNGRLAGVGLDVYNCERELAELLRDGKKISDFAPQIQEELNAVLEMMKNPSFILTPHNAFNTEESVLRKSQNTAENLRAFFENGKFITPIEN